MKRTSYIVIAAVAVAAAAALAWAFAPRAIVVETAAVDRGVFEQTVDEDGKTRVRERYVVSAPLAGRVQRIALKAGDAVGPGVVVALLDPAAPQLLDARTWRELQERLGAAEAALARARSTVVQARATLAQSRADLERTRKLADGGFLSAASLERDELKASLDARSVEAAEFERHAAEHQVELARAALMRTRQALEGARAAERLEIRSPVRGRVLRVAQESEAAVAMGAPLVEIGDPGDLEAVVDVLTADAVHIAPRAPVRLDIAAADEALEGRVRLVEPSAFTKISALGVEEQRVNVVIDLVSAPARWRNVGDGYRVDAHIVVHREDGALRVPVSALFRSGAAWAVFVVRDGRAELRTIELARRGASLALVKSGVAEGERVILYPGEAVRDGAKVSATQR